MPFLKKNQGGTDQFKISQSQKKYICLLLIISGLGVFLIFIGNTLAPQSPSFVKNNTTQVDDSNPEKSGASLPATSSLGAEEQALAQELATILGSVEGVGAVTVKVTLAATPETHYASNLQNSQSETNETLQNGGTRTTRETRVDNTLVMKKATQGEDEPVVLKKTKPEVVGVLVVAEGASRAAVMAQISTAVQVVLAIPSHKINVLPKAKEDGV